ncbi:MAG: isopeptide-forming domain-containing fimbrial protein [Oscillospiraceae bacterium]|nr:isopeptide-forming domain-containing fimbrial protein [Oscillospiraceae bacterium]
MKKLKKILSGVAAIAMAASSFMGLTTAHAAGTGSVTFEFPVEITAVQNSDVATIAADYSTTDGKNEVSMNAYKVFDTATNKPTDDFASFFPTLPSGYTGGTLYLQTKTDGTLELVASEQKADAITISAKLDTQLTAASILDYFYNNGNSSETSTSADFAKFIGWLEAYAANKTPTSVKATASGSDYNITGLDAGYWLFVATKVPSGVSNVKTMVKVIEGSTSTVKVKAEGEGIEKTVNDAKTTTASVGDTLNYKVVVDVPDLTEYTLKTDSQYKYIFTDTMENQELVAGSVKVTIGTEEYTIGGTPDLMSLLKDNGYTSAANSTNNKNWDLKLDFKISALRTAANNALQAAGGASITIEYQAKLTSDAIKTNKNGVTVEYSNNPKDESSTGKLTDETTTYTFGLDVTKDFSDGSTDQYANVKFVLQKADGTPINVIKVSDGVYKVADANDTPLSYTGEEFIKLNNKNFTIFGLKEGTYKLVEQPITGYKTKTVTVTIDVSKDASGAYTVNSDADDVTNATFTGNDTTNANVQLTVLNEKDSFNLPGSGGAGVWLFGIAGMLMLAGAAYVFTRKRGQA